MSLANQATKLFKENALGKILNVLNITKLANVSPVSNNTHCFRVYV